MPSKKTMKAGAAKIKKEQAKHHKTLNQKRRRAGRPTIEKTDVWGRTTLDKKRGVTVDESINRAKRRRSGQVNKKERGSN